MAVVVKVKLPLFANCVYFYFVFVLITETVCLTVLDIPARSSVRTVRDPLS